MIQNRRALVTSEVSIFSSGAAKNNNNNNNDGRLCQPAQSSVFYVFKSFCTVYVKEV